MGVSSSALFLFFSLARVSLYGWVQVVGDSRCPIMDTWWQTETGSHLITPLPGAIALKPGSATLPFFGVEPAVLNEKGEELSGEAEGSASFFAASSADIAVSPYFCSDVPR